MHEVVTDRGSIRTDVVVCAAGMYTPQVARMVGVTVPIVPYAHEFLVTESFDPPLPALPTLRDPDNLIYYRTEVGGLIMGGYERQPQAWALDGVPDGFEAELLPEDWERFDEILQNSVMRVPAMEQAEVRKLFNGPEAFTPDGEFILGESEVPGFWVAAGFCAHGLAGAGGIGWQMAEWIVEGEPSLDLWHMDIRRFGAQYRSRRYALARATEVYATYYDIKYPNHERQAGRPLRLSPAYERLRELGASFGEKSGWERANWFDSNAGLASEQLRPRGWAGHHWSPAIAAESLAHARAGRPLRRDVVCQDRGARPGCGRVPAGPVRERRRPAGGFGHLHPDAELAGRDRVRLHGDPAGRPALPHRHRHRLWQPRPGLAAQAPARRRLGGGGGRHLGPRLPGDLGAACPGHSAAADRRRPGQRLVPVHDGAGDLAVGHVPCLAARVTYVGELGWELYCPAEYGAGLWDLLWEAGRPHDMLACGYRAIDSLRVEKGYRVWGADITPEDDPFEAGLGFAVKLDKGEFVGREALAAATRGWPSATACAACVLDDPRAVTLGSEPLRVDGAVVGRVTTGGYGFAVDRSIAYGYLPVAADVGARVDVEVFGEWVGAEVVAESPWDPRGERIRA